jgi:hypothetical protein
MGLEFKFYGSRFRVQDPGVQGKGSRFRLYGLGFRVDG